MKFYRENKINPYASCLPIVFQIPIFISLYYSLRHFENGIAAKPAYKGDSLTWLHLVNITEHTSVGWGPLLLVIYVASQLTSTYLMSNQMQSPAQRWMIMVLPVVFVPFILNFPSGLMIYWLTTNLWTTGQGIVTRRLLPRPAPPPKRTSRTPPKETAATPAPAAASSGPVRTGPPRRVKKKRGGGRPRR
jgi:YidC/Oxa1 family membrane protein insertase